MANAVKVAKLGGQKTELNLEAPTTVEDVLKQAKLQNTKEHDIILNGRNASKEDIVNPGDIVALVPRIKGGKWPA